MVEGLRNVILLALRRLWRATWELLPFADHPLRIRIASHLRGALGVPTGYASQLHGKAYHSWIVHNDTITDSDRYTIRAHIREFSSQPQISIIMPVYNAPEALLRAAIASVRAQLYPNWELCIADDASTMPHVLPILTEFARADARIHVVVREQNGHISAASNSALALARGDYVTFMDHDDLIAEHALYEVVAELERFPNSAVIYSDEDKIDDSGLRWGPYFKPDFDPDLLLAQNLINHLAVYRRDLVQKLGGLRLGMEGSQDHDLALRATADCGAERVRHIPAVLYHWRQAPHGSSFSQTSLSRCTDARERAVREALSARGVSVTLECAPLLPSYLRVIRPVLEPAPLVSIIVPTRDQPRLLRACADGVLNRTDYRNLEFIVVDNGSIQAETAALFSALQSDARVRILNAPGPFNYSALNNRAVAGSKGDVVLLLNNDIEVIRPTWLNELVSHAMRPGVGAVGAKLLYPTGKIQHAGVVVGVGGIAGHYCLGAPGSDPGPYGSLALVRQVSAVTGACLAVRAELYRAVGGLDEDNLAVAFNDVDFCLRLVEAGYRNIWTPFAELYHLESVSRGADTFGDKARRFQEEGSYMKRRWATEAFEDPAYNVNLDLADGSGAVAAESRRIKPWLRSKMCMQPL